MSLLASRKSLVAGSIIAFYFLQLTHGGVATYFTDDDVINIAFLHGYGRIPLGIILAQALTVFTSEYRPVGGIYYRTLFALFGFHPVPFRIAFFVLLGLNLALAWRWFRQISNSRATAVVGTLFFSFHPALAELYYNDGTIYDVLCLFFTLLLLSRYVRVRQENQYFTTNSFLSLMALYGAALGSKEMALTLPGVLILYEAIFHPQLQNLRRRVWPVLVLATMTVVCMTWKIMLPNQMSININGGYTPRYQAAFIAHAYLRYYQLLSFKYDLNGVVLGATLILALMAALALRNRVMLFGLIFANLTLFPVCVIPPRAGFVWYMPLLGWALYGGSAISQFITKLISWVQARNRAERLRSNAATWLQAVLFGLLVIAWYILQVRHTANLGVPFLPKQQALKNLLAAARTASPTLPSGSRVLLESNPFPEVAWEPLFLLRLGYGDSTIWVERGPHLGRDYNPNDLSLYTMRMHWNGSSYDVVVQHQLPGVPVHLVVNPPIVHRSHATQVQFPVAFANCPIDVAYRMPEDELMRAGVWLSWTQPGADGRGAVWADRDAERGLIVIDHLRACHGEWISAQGSFMIVP